MVKLTDVIYALSTNRSAYKNLTNKDKGDWFFIVNRYFSKLFPEYTNRLNIKGMDNSVCMDLLYIYLDKKIPNRFNDIIWSKGIKKETVLQKKDNNLLLRYYEISQKDLDFLIKLDIDVVKSELKYVKKIMT